MPTYFFADLVRVASYSTGTGPFVLGDAVPGHRSFGGGVPDGREFHYAIAGITVPAEWETGVGTIDASGRLMRSRVTASSASGALVDFTDGLKTAALTVGSEWFSGQDSALAARQPLSTGHPAVAHGAAGDTVTAQRGTGWVNIPLSGFAWRGSNGWFDLAGAVTVPDGTATAPALAFASDSGSGWFRTGSAAICLSIAGSERLRVAANGNVGIGCEPIGLTRLQVATAANTRFSVFTSGGGENLIGFLSDAGSWLDTVVSGNPLRFYSSGTERMRVSEGGNVGIGAAAPAERLEVAGNILLSNGTDRRLTMGSSTNYGYDLATAGDNFVIRDAAGVAALVVQYPGRHVRPGTDNDQTLGTASVRWSVVYAGTGTINTSDAREKLWRGGLTATELRAARRIAAEIGAFQWNDAVSAKGTDAARLHFGVRAQAVWAIMADERLVDPIGKDGRPGATPYAFLCWDDDDAGGRFGVRPDQIALFIAAAQEMRLAAIEAAS